MASKKKASKKVVAKKQRNQTKAPSLTTPKVQRPYPNRTLEEALVIPQAIREKNNGNPWATEDVALASMGVSKTNNKFFYTAAAARDYGLTVGTRDTEKIELGTLGREIVFAVTKLQNVRKWSTRSFQSTYSNGSTSTMGAPTYQSRNS